MDAQEPAAPGSDPVSAVRALIASLRSPGAVNAGFAEALIALLEATLEHEGTFVEDDQSDEGRDADGDSDGE
jgi:signal transduction histidine kinase